MENEEKVNILIVDNTLANLLSIKSILDELDQNIICANSGEEALKYLLQKDFSVILLDVYMPGLNGFETAALIRQRPRSTHTPIIFVTALGTTEIERNKGYLFGAVDYILSPVVPEILLTKVLVFNDLFRMSWAFKRQAEELTMLGKKMEKQVVKSEQLNQQLEGTNKELEAFSYSVSHDLRSTLSVVIGYSEMIISEYADKLDERGREFLEILHEKAWKMNELIEALLKLSRMSHQSMKHHRVNLSTMIKTMAEELQKIEPERQVKFVIEKGIFAKGDNQLLMVALQNLLSNAWKYSSKQPQSLIEFGALLLEETGKRQKAGHRRHEEDRRKETEDRRKEERNISKEEDRRKENRDRRKEAENRRKGPGDRRKEENKIIYFVRDNGVGFDMSCSNNLFHAFNRLHTDAEFKGIGIGLTIVQRVQRVIQRHNGRIWIEAKPNEGATFYFTLGD